MYLIGLQMKEENIIMIFRIEIISKKNKTSKCQIMSLLLFVVRFGYTMHLLICTKYF